MIKHEMNAIVFSILPQRDEALHQLVRRHLINIGDIDINLLVYMALNQLTINQLVSAAQTKNIEQLCHQHLPNNSYEHYQVVMFVCEQIALLLYNDYRIAIEQSRMPLPSRMIEAKYSNGVVTMVFESMDDQSCVYSYTTLLQ